MSSFKTRLVFAAFLVAGAVTVSKAGAETPHPPAITLGNRFSFTPQPGTAWNLEGSETGESWSVMGGPFFATGSVVEHSTPRGRFTRFRLAYVDPASVGKAPVTLDHTSVMMEKAGAPVEVVFMSATTGFIRMDATHARSFTYTWRKTSPDAGEAILSGLDGTFTLVRLKFIDGRLGSWGMEDIATPESASLIHQPVDGGAFSFIQGRFGAGLAKGELPLDFAGSSLVLNEGGSLSHVEFTGEETLKLTTAKGKVLNGTYTYDPASATRGTLFLSVADALPLPLDLTLTAPGTGKFKEIVAPPQQGGVAAIPRNGTLSLPERQFPPDNPDCPPDNLGGRIYVINDSSPCTLTFNGDGTGMQMREVNGTLQKIYFTYSYNRTGRSSASVTVTFPGAGSDLIDDYQMDFSGDCSGAFRRDSYANGNSAGSTDGTFGPGSIAGMRR